MTRFHSVLPVLGVLGFVSLVALSTGCVMTAGGQARFPTAGLLRAQCAVQVTALDPRTEVSSARAEGNAPDEVAAVATRVEGILSFMGYEIVVGGDAPYEFRFRRTGFVYEDETRGGGCVVDYEVVDREADSVVAQGTFRKDSATYFAYYSSRKSPAEIAAKYCREMVEALFFQAPDCRPGAAPATLKEPDPVPGSD